MSDNGPAYVVHEAECGVRVQLLGDVGIEQSAALQAVLLKTLDEHADQQIVVDCSEVKSLDIAVMQILLSAASQPGNRLAVNPGTKESPASNSLKGSGLDRLIPLVSHEITHNSS